MFSNLRYPVKSADLIIIGRSLPLKLVGGYWEAWTGPISGQTSFRIKEANGYSVPRRPSQHVFVAFSPMKSPFFSLSSGLR